MLFWILRWPRLLTFGGLCLVGMGWDKHISNAISASDCLSLVVEGLNSSAFDRSSIGSAVANTKLLTVGFASVMLKHVRRRYNVVAHLY